MRMTLKRLTAWMLTLMMVFSCVSASAVDGSVVDYSDSTSAYDVMPLDDGTSENITVTFVINNSAYTSDPGSGTTHITAKAPIEGGTLTYTKWAGRYKVTGTGTVCSYDIPAGTSLSDKGYSFPALSVENIGNTNTYSYTSLTTWVTPGGMVCSTNTVFTENTTLQLQLYETAVEAYSLDFVCSEDNHSIKSIGSFQLGQSISQAYIDAATEAANAFESQFCTYGPASGQRLQKWQLKKTATGEMVDLVAGMAITEEYVNSQFGTAIKVYAVWEENASTPVTATFQYVTTDAEGTQTVTNIETRSLNAGDALGALPDMTAYNTPYETFESWQYTDAEGNEHTAMAETVIMEDTVYTAVFTEVPCGIVCFHDMQPAGTEAGITVDLSVPEGMTLAAAIADNDPALEDDTQVSGCIWRTKAGELADMSAVVAADSEIHLYTYTYQIVLTLNPKTAAEAAGIMTLSLVETDTAEDGTITMTITAREGEQLTADDFIVNGTDMTQYAWTDGNGNAIDLQKLMDEGVTESITATSDGTLAEEPEEGVVVSFRLEGGNEIYSTTVPSETDLFDWINENGETKTSHIIAGNAVKLGAFDWKNSDGTEIADGQTVTENITVIGTLSDVTVTFYNDSGKTQPIGDVVTLSYGGTVSSFPTEHLTAPEGTSFVEWRYEGTEGEVRFDSSTPVYEDMQVYAHYANMHTLTFYADSERTQVAGTVQVAHGGLFDTAQYPNVTAPEGQTLRYWVYVVGDTVQVFNPLLPVTADMSLYPVFDKYVFVLKDEETGKTITSIYAGDPVNFTVEAPEGYYYAGVELGDGMNIVTDGTQIASTDLFKVTEAVNGQYTVNVTPVFKEQLTVVYHAGEGATILAAAGADTYTQTVDASVQMPGALDIVRTDSSSAVALSGWATTAGATTAQYTASEVVTSEQLKESEDENGEIHLYPVWTPAENAVAVTFVSKYPDGAVDEDGNALTNISYTIYITSGAKPVMPTLDQVGMQTPSNVFGENNDQQRYTLSGWSVDPTGRGDNAGTVKGAYVVGSQYQTQIVENTIFYAIWIDADEASAKTRAYFYIRSDGSIPQEPGGYSKSDYYPLASGTTLAGYIKKPINIVNDPNKVALNIEEGPSAEDIIDMLYGSRYSLQESDGWGTSGQNVTYKGVTLLAEDYGTTWWVEWYACKDRADGQNFNVDGRIRLANQYMVTYMPNGGTSANMPTSKLYTVDSNVTVEYKHSTNTDNNGYPIREGYTFLGWDTNPDAETPMYPVDTDQIFKMPAYDVVLYAIWKPDTLELSFDGVKYMLENGQERAASQEFSFLVEKQNADGSYTTVKTLTNSMVDGTFSFDYEFDSSGLHTFRVTEVKGADTTIAYDGAVYTITVYIGDGDQGLYEVGRTVMKNNVIQSDTTVKFVNRVGTRDVTVTKVWDDNNDQDGIRPSYIDVSLTRDGDPHGSSQRLIAANGWSATWSDLPIADNNGTQHQYKVIETSAGVGYTSATTGDMDSGFTITNTHTPMTTEITVTKQWIDNSDAAKVRPNEIVLTLTGSDGSTRTETLTGTENNWTHTFTGLPVYAGGVPVTYTLDETDVPAGYTKAVNGYTVVNTLQSYSFAVHKRVEGNFASRTKKFSFTANILSSDKNKVIRTETFTLAHNGSKTITNIPYGAYVQVTEHSDGDGYEAQHQLGQEIVAGASYTTTQPITNNDHGVTFINTKNVSIDTGVDLDGLPYIMLLLGAAGISLVWLLLRRSRKNED